MSDEQDDNNIVVNKEVLINRFWILLAMILSCFGASLINEGLIFILIGFYIVAFVVLTTPTSLFSINLFINQTIDDNEEEEEDYEFEFNKSDDTDSEDENK